MQANTPRISIAYLHPSLSEHITNNKSNPLAIFLLILAGETIFLLPFVIPRVIRPTMLEVLNISNTQLGTFFSVYGIVALGSYLFGGPLADKFPAPKLMSVALATTAVGGVFLSFAPDPSSMRVLYGFWGLTTILLFWAALMKATRLWGGIGRQGRAFGLLDGGRGLVAAIIGYLLVQVFALAMPEGSNAVTASHRLEAFQLMILAASGWVFFVAILVWFGLPSRAQQAASSKSSISLNTVKQVVKLPAVWFQSMLILCAYSGYKTTDDFSLLVHDVLNYTEVQSAEITSYLLWIRPISAISAGFLADRISPSRMISFCFGLMILGGLLIGTRVADANSAPLIMIAIGSTAMGVYAMRGLYFAIMGEAEIPVAVTGTAVGIASIVGYLPDIYMGPLMGVMLDSSPGVVGHQHVFLTLTGFASMGMLVSFLFRRHLK